MLSQLPAPVQTFLRASNAQDAVTATSAFADDASVLDEGHVHEGREAIGAWCTSALAQYAPVVEVEGFEGEIGEVRVVGLVSGNFPGSPARLHYAFRLRGDQIVSLAITV